MHFGLAVPARQERDQKRSQSHLLHRAKHMEDCTHEHREDDHQLQGGHLVFWGSVDHMVGQKDHGGSDHEPAPEALLLASRVHVGSNDDAHSPINNLLIKMAETQTYYN